MIVKLQVLWYSKKVKNNYKQEQAVNLAEMETENFIDYYNQNIPDSFPKATKEALAQFQVSHTALFADSKLWTIDKHRRRLMDWLPSYHIAV